MATKSIGLTGRDFSTAAAWASYVNALALTAPEVGEVYNDGGPVADTTIVQIDGYTGANSTNTVTLRAATNQGFATTAGALQWNSANGAALTNNTGYLNTSGAYRFTTGYFILDGLQLRSTSPSARVVMFGGTNVLISNCILRAISTASAAIYSQVGPGRKIQNTVVIHAGTTDCLAVEGVDLLTVDGCTLVKLGAASGVVRRPAP